MDKKQKVLLEKQLRKCRMEFNKLSRMEGFEEIDTPTTQGLRKFGDKLSEMIIELNKLNI